MKCFEKAAEKCESDSLGCVVSSCSWGKHAAIGTGSSFEILWNENQLKSNKEYGDGLYDFLALVRTDQEKAGYTFLDDVDYLVAENAVDDVCLSPEPDGILGKPTFEDNFEEHDIQKGSSWENGATMNSSWEQNGSAGNDSGDWGGWSNGAAAATKPLHQDNSCWDVHAVVENNSTDWGGWGTEKQTNGEQAETDTWADKGARVESSAGDNNWEKSSTPEDHGPWGNMPASASENAWDKQKGDGGDSAWEKQKCSSKLQEMDVDQVSWCKKTTPPSSNMWDKKKSDGGHGNWQEQPSSWNEQTLNVDQDSWGNDKEKKKSHGGESQWAERVSTYKRKRANADDSWDNMAMSPSNNAWNTGKGVGRSNTKSDGGSSWGNRDNMGTHEHSEALKESDPWSTGKSNGKSWEKTDALQDSWGKSAADNNNMQEDSLDKKALTGTNSQQDSWGNMAIQNNNTLNDSWENGAQKVQTSAAEDSWGNPAATPAGNADAKQSDSWDGWNAATPAENSQGKWNETTDSGNNEGWKSDGWGGTSGNWSGQRNNSGRPPRRLDERGPPPPRQRFELTTEEKNMIKEVEPILMRIRRISREACDGVRLQPEDEKFIQEKVLENHPEKQSKVSGAIDYIMVDKHQTFQDTRCFFVVSTDGSRSDFSYLKCLENFVRKNYKEDVDAFCMKYLRPRRRQARPADAVATPGIPAEAPPSTAAETEQGTPAPPVEVPQEIGGSPGAAPEETPKPDSTGIVGILKKQPDLTPASPVAAPQGVPELDSTGDAGTLEKQPDLTPASPVVTQQEVPEPDSTEGGGILGKGPDLTAESPAVSPQVTPDPYSMKPDKND